MGFDIDLLKKFYRDECSEAEVKQVLKCFIDPAQKEHILSSIELNWFKFETNETDEQKAITDIKEKLKSKISPSGNVKKEVFILKKPYIWKLAAVISLAFTISYLLWNRTSSIPKELPQGLISNNYIIKTTPKGNKLHTMLSDGSMVILNSESKITYKESHFSDSIRLVYLEGEAYFQVAKNDSVPFVVSTRNLTITALGTSFNVRTYSEESKIYVALEEGKVSVEKNASTDDDVVVFLNPGEIVAYDITSEKISPKDKLVFDEHFGWKKGLLIFNEDNLSEVIKKLERWYGVEFVILNQDRSAGWRYKGRFNNESLTNVLRGLSDTKSFDYEIQEKTVYIRFNS